MANFFKNFLNSMKFSEEDDDYEEYLSEQEEKDRKRSERMSVSEQTYKTRETETRGSVQEETSHRNITQLEERRTKNSVERPKVVQFRNSSYREELGLYVSKPKLIKLSYSKNLHHFYVVCYHFIMVFICNNI